MIGAVIILLTLIVAFTEKPHLFKRPIKVEKVLIIALLLGTAIFSTVKEYKADSEEERNSKVIDSLNGGTKVLNAMIISLRSESKVAQREYVDSLNSNNRYYTELLGKYGIKVDTLTNKITNLDSNVQKEVPPTLRILLPDTPLTKMYEHRERVFNYNIQALNADVHLVDYRYIYVNLLDSNGWLKLDTPNVWWGRSMNYTTIIAQNENYPYSIFLDRNSYLKDYFAIALEFDYKSKSNKRQIPVRKIFIISLKDNTVHEASNDMHYKISLHLKDCKIWPVFYDL